MICLHLACGAEPVSPFLPEDNEDISALCLVIVWLPTTLPPPPPPLPTHHDLIAFLCSNNPFRIPSPVSERLTRPPGAASVTQLGGDLVGLVLAGTLKGQEILQSVGQTVLPLLLGRGTPGIQREPPGSGSAPAVKASQKPFQILQPVPQLLRL